MPMSSFAEGLRSEANKSKRRLARQRERAARQVWPTRALRLLAPQSEASPLPAGTGEAGNA